MSKWNKVSDKLPDIAGRMYYLTVENREYGKKDVIEGFFGYGDYKWYTMNVGYMTDPAKGKNAIHPTWNVIAWAEKEDVPEPYIPEQEAKKYKVSFIWGHDLKLHTDIVEAEEEADAIKTVFQRWGTGFENRFVSIAEC